MKLCVISIEESCVFVRLKNGSSAESIVMFFLHLRERPYKGFPKDGRENKFGNEV